MLLRRHMEYFRPGFSLSPNHYSPLTSSVNSMGLPSDAETLIGSYRMLPMLGRVIFSADLGPRFCCLLCFLEEGRTKEQSR